MLAAGLLLRLVSGSTAFGLDRIDEPSVRWTQADAILAAVALPLGTNVFDVETAPIEARLTQLPAIRSATVSVALPATLVVSVVEREPILAWRVDGTSYLVDRDGVLFATADASTVAAANLRIVTDERAASALDLAVGGRLDPVDLDVATRLAALEPADIGSSATRIAVGVDDVDGYILRAGKPGWTAVFGRYSPSLRSADLIPGQVQLLRSLLAGREPTLDRIILADATNGTYTLRATPSR
jgi:hypothetical protein